MIRFRIIFRFRIRVIFRVRIRVSFRVSVTIYMFFSIPTKFVEWFTVQLVYRFRLSSNISYAFQQSVTILTNGSHTRFS